MKLFSRLFPKLTSKPTSTTSQWKGQVRVLTETYNNGSSMHKVQMRNSGSMFWTDVQSFPTELDAKNAATRIYNNLIASTKVTAK